MIDAAGFGQPRVGETLLSRRHPAVRIGIFVLGLGTAWAQGWWTAVPMVVIAGGALAAAGWPPARQLGQLRPWWPVALLVVVVHLLTATGAAPLGHPSWLGLQRGLLALVRLTGAVLFLGLFLRSTGPDDLVTGLRWWLAPLGRLGVPVGDLGLVVAVALGSVGPVVGEGRRLEAVSRLRRASGRRGGRSVGNRLDRWRLRAQMIVPLLEGLARKADATALALSGRRPGLQTVPAVRGLEVLLMLVWLAGLILWALRPLLRWSP
ncbi:MAG: CbiQ family ECF transporter T component [Candidatus Krumholzibacteriia bacterium]